MSSLTFSFKIKHVSEPAEVVDVIVDWFKWMTDVYSMSLWCMVVLPGI